MNSAFHAGAAISTDAVGKFIRSTEEVGVLVMVSGVVGTNIHRRLDLAEFRGFALSDSLAPLVLINGAEAKAAEMFALAHELAQLWLGVSAVSNVDASNLGLAPGPGFRREEVWCNAVAPEFLLSRGAFAAELADLARIIHGKNRQNLLNMLK